jgi:hypothetical protein
VTVDNRSLALQLAIKSLELVASTGHATADDIAKDATSVATAYYRWLEGPVTLVVVADSVTYEQADPDGPGTPTVMKGNSVQLTDLQQVTLTVAEEDSKNQPVTGDSLVWTVDNTAAVTLTPSADTYSCVVTAVSDGTATVTVTDNSATPPLVGTDAITVVSSAATSLVISEGTPTAS